MAIANLNVARQTTIKINDVELSSISDGSMVLEEYLTDGRYFEYGGCCGATFEFQTLDAVAVGDSVVMIYQMGNNDPYERFRGKVVSVDTDKLHNVSTVSCIDLYSATIADQDASDWFNGLSFPMTFGALADAYIERMGFGGGRTGIANSTITIPRAVEVTGLTFSDIGKMIGQATASFGIFTPSGFSFVPYSFKGLVNVTDNMRSSSQIGDTMLEQVQRVHIGTNDNDIGGSYGEGEIVYNIIGNLLFYGCTSATLNRAAQNIYGNIHGITIWPALIDSIFSGDVELGHRLTVVQDGVSKRIFACHIRYSGSQLTKQSIFCELEVQRPKTSAPVVSEIKVLNNHTHIIESDVNGTREIVESIQGDYASKTYVNTTAEGIETRISQTYATQASLEEIQEQIDGNIDTWSGSAVPTLSNYPANQWTTETDKKKHIGDLYFKDDGKSYRFTRSSGGAYSWQLMQDTGLAEAIQTANDALSKANSVESTLLTSYSTTTDVQRDIKQSADGTLDTISKTYATQASVQTVDGKFANYSTTTASQNYTNNAVDVFSRTISETYTTKTELGNLVAGGRNFFTNAQNAVASPVSDRIRLVGQVGDTTIGEKNQLQNASPYAHGYIVRTADDTAYPWIRFGEHITSPSASKASMNGLTAGQEYTLSCRLDFRLFSTYTGTASRHFRLALYWGKQGETTWQTIVKDFDVRPGIRQELGKIKWTFTVPADATACYLIFRPAEVASGYFSSTDYFRFSDILLEEGSIASSWIAAPEETDTRIAKAESSITQNATNISLKVSLTDYTGAKIASLIEATPSTARIKAPNIDLEGLTTINGNFQVLADGSIKAKNGNFTGIVNATSGAIGKWILHDGRIQNNTGSIYFSLNDGDLLLNSPGFLVDQGGNVVSAGNFTTSGTVRMNAVVAEYSLRMASSAGRPETEVLWTTSSSSTAAPTALNVGGRNSTLTRTNINTTLYNASGAAITSDRNRKHDIMPIAEQKAIDFISELVPVSFKYNDGTSGRNHHGFIAQDIKQAMGENDWGVYIDDGEFKAVRYEEIIADLVAVVQRQQKDIATLKEAIERMK